MDCVQWSRPIYPVVLAQGELHVWRGWLDGAATDIDRYSSFLSEDEKARAARFAFPDDRSHFVAGRGLLRDLLGMYLRCAPEKLRFKTGQFGKLSLADHPKLRFNLSHSYGLVLYAFALERELGIDAEKIRPEFATEEIAERYFSVAEQHELRALPTELRTEAFFLCWTRKEAYVKAHGDGLQIALESFDVSLTPGKPETLRSHDSKRWSLQSFTPTPGYAAAISAEGSPESMRFWDLPARFLTQES